jgi:prophage regulatory protein
MRATDDRASNEPVAPYIATQRTLKAAHLLQEALALLGFDSIQEMARTATRAHDRLLRLPDVERLTGLRRSAIYEQMQRGVFPRSVKVGKRAATWSEASVQAWIADRKTGEGREVWRARRTLDQSRSSSARFDLLRSGFGDSIRAQRFRHSQLAQKI